MEIYCERVKDLLNPKSQGNLRVRWVYTHYTRHTHTHTQTYAHTRTHAPTHTHTHIHTHIHTHTHTHTHTLLTENIPLLVPMWRD